MAHTTITDQHEHEVHVVQRGEDPADERGGLARDDETEEHGRLAEDEQTAHHVGHGARGNAPTTTPGLRSGSGSPDRGVLRVSGPREPTRRSPRFDADTPGTS